MDATKKWPGIEELRRANLRWFRLCDGLSRAYLPCGGFVDRADKHGHESNGYKYGLWAPSSPCARFIRGGDTMAELRA